MTDRKQHEAFLSHPDTVFITAKVLSIVREAGYLKIQPEHLTVFFILWFTYLF